MKSKFCVVSLSVVVIAVLLNTDPSVVAKPVGPSPGTYPRHGSPAALATGALEPRESNRVEGGAPNVDPFGVTQLLPTGGEKFSLKGSNDYDKKNRHGVDNVFKDFGCGSRDCWDESLGEGIHHPVSKLSKRSLAQLKNTKRSRPPRTLAPIGTRRVENVEKLPVTSTAASSGKRTPNDQVSQNQGALLIAHSNHLNHGGPASLPQIKYNTFPGMTNDSPFPSFGSWGWHVRRAVPQGGVPRHLGHQTAARHFDQKYETSGGEVSVKDPQYQTTFEGAHFHDKPSEPNYPSKLGDAHGQGVLESLVYGEQCNKDDNLSPKERPTGPDFVKKQNYEAAKNSIKELFSKPGVNFPPLTPASHFNPHGDENHDEDYREKIKLSIPSAVHTIQDTGPEPLYYVSHPVPRSAVPSSQTPTSSAGMPLMRVRRGRFLASRRTD